jgi:hypothetical protein
VLLCRNSINHLGRHGRPETHHHRGTIAGFDFQPGVRAGRSFEKPNPGWCFHYFCHLLSVRLSENQRNPPIAVGIDMDLIQWSLI